MAENVYSELVEPILYYGDNLEILRRYIEDESVDLVYLDPPFKSDQDYNILFAERNGSRAVSGVVGCGRARQGRVFLLTIVREF
jgi:site-specific DNA-methyltransferase (adenine-specific)